MNFSADDMANKAVNGNWIERTRYVLNLAFTFLCASCAVSSSGREVSTDGKDVLAIHFRFGENELNTFEGFIVKDLVADGYARTQYQMPSGDAAAISEKLEEIGFFDIQGPYLRGRRPLDAKNSLRATVGGRTNFLEWEMGSGETEVEQDLYELSRLIYGVLEKSPEWKSMPPARGARQ